MDNEEDPHPTQRTQMIEDAKRMAIEAMIRRDNVSRMIYMDQFSRLMSQQMDIDKERIEANIKWS